MRRPLDYANTHAYGSHPMCIPSSSSSTQGQHPTAGEAPPHLKEHGSHGAQRKRSLVSAEASSGAGGRGLGRGAGGGRRGAGGGRRAARRAALAGGRRGGGGAGRQARRRDRRQRRLHRERGGQRRGCSRRRRDRRAARHRELARVVDVRALADLQRVVAAVGDGGRRRPGVGAAGGGACDAVSFRRVRDRLASDLLVIVATVVRAPGLPSRRMMVTGWVESPPLHVMV